MKKQLLVVVAFTVALAATSQAALTWNGTDGEGLFLESNWLDNNGVVPADGTINGGTGITADTGGLISITTSSPGNFTSNFDLGANNTLFIDGQNLISGGSQGLRVNGSSSAIINDIILQNGAFTHVQFILDMNVTLNGGSTLRLKGGGNPVNISTIDLLDTASMILFQAETYTAFNNEHSSKVTYNGAALEFGSDPFVAEAGDNALATPFNGTSGVQIQAIPEPATLSLFAAVGGAIIFFRRRRHVSI